MQNTVVIESHQLDVVTEKREIQRMLSDILSKQDEIKGNKMILKSYPIASVPLDDLKKKKKVLDDAMKQEKERIEENLLKDKDFEAAKHNELKLKNELKEQTAVLRLHLKNQHKIASVYTDKYEVKGTQMKLQLEFNPAIFLEGKQLR